MVTTTNKGFELPAELSPNWNVPLNANFEKIDTAIGGRSAITLGATTVVTLTEDQYRCLTLVFSGTLVANTTCIIPDTVGGQWIVRNNTGSTFTLTLKSGSSDTGIELPRGGTRTVYATPSGGVMRFADDIASSIPATAIAYSDGDQLTGSVDFFYDGSIVTVNREASAGGSPLNTLRLSRTTSGTVASGLGTGLIFATETLDGGTIKDGVNLRGILEDATSGSETYKAQIRLMAGGVAAETFFEFKTTGAYFLDDALLSARAATNTNPQSVGYAGFTSTADNDGTITGGTYTPTPAGGNMKRIVNGGAFTLAAPTLAGDYTIVLLIRNGSSAGAITLSGFTKTSGDIFTTTNNHKFLVYITKLNDVVFASVAAQQ